MGAGLTQRELAAAAGVSIGALRDLEQGRTRCPQWGSVAAIAAALDIDRYQRAALASVWSGSGPDGGLVYGTVPADGFGLAAVRIGVLGPLSVVREGSVLSLGSARQAALLGLLALHWPTGVHCGTIIDALWRERPPRSAAAEVQAYVSKLRRLLDPGRKGRAHGGPVELAGGCYRLTGQVAVDVEDLRQMSRRADASAARGEFRLASALYEQSLSLWRGEVLAGIDVLHGHPAVIEATRRCAEVVQRFARIASVGNGYERVLPHLRALCAREPFNEQAHALLMTALAATGQQAAALELFGEIRRRLDSELGIRPGAALAAAHLRVLRRQVG